MNRLPALLGGFALFSAVFLGCGGDDLVLPGDGTPAQLEITDGDGQPGLPNLALPESLEVRVLDSRGSALPGQTVTFQPETEASGARVVPENATTRDDGKARALWVLGPSSGTQRVVAQVVRGEEFEPLVVTFNARVSAAGASRMAAAEGNGQTGPVGNLLPGQLLVLITDEFGNPVAGVPVDWEAQDGTVDPTSSVTGADGRAGTSWTLGPSAGAQTVVASSPQLEGSRVEFTATARSGNPNSLVRVSGDGQSAAAGTELPNALVVRLVDEAGNGVPDRPVSWVVASGGGSVAPATSTTDEAGRASTSWTVGAGANTLNAVVSGVGVVGFTATGTSGGGGGGGGGGASTPTRMEFRVQPSDTEEGETMSPSVQVAVLDQAGNLVTDREFPIKLELLDDRGRVRAEGTARTRSGVATFTIRLSRDGEYRLRASTDGLPSVESDRFEVEDD